MLSRSLLTLLLSIPACVAFLGAVLMLAPGGSNKVLPTLLLFFPLWIAVASCCYLLPSKRWVATTLLTIIGIGFAVIEASQLLGVAAL